jgi:RNA polymerase sigma-70 factor (ECF subfamily)
LYDSASSAVYSFAVRTLGESADAEEVTLDVFRHVWQCAANWDPGRGSVIAWLLMLTRSRCLDRLRTRESRRRAEEPVRQQPVTGEIDPVQMDRAQRVRNALAELPPEQRELIELAWFDGMSQSELAERTGAPLGTVKTRIRLGMMRLKNLLQELDSY